MDTVMVLGSSSGDSSLRVKVNIGLKDCVLRGHLNNIPEESPY